MTILFGIANQFSDACTKSIGSARRAFPRWCIAQAGGAGIPRRSSRVLAWPKTGTAVIGSWNLNWTDILCVRGGVRLHWFNTCDEILLSLRPTQNRALNLKNTWNKAHFMVPIFLTYTRKKLDFSDLVAGPPITSLKCDILGYIFHCKCGSSVTLAWYGMCGICDMLLCDVF